MVEAVGILGNIVVRGLDYAQLLTKCDMLSYIKSKLQPGKVERLTRRGGGGEDIGTREI